MSQYKFGDGKLAAVLIKEEEALFLELQDRSGRKAWDRVPLLALEIYAKAEFRIEVLRKYRIDRVDEIANGLHVSLGDGFRQIRIGLWLRIADGELSVTMPMAEVYEDKAATHRLFSVIVLPGLLQAGTGGQVLLPLNTGIVFSPAGKPRLADRFMVYGEQSRWELMPMLPVCGMQTPAGGLMALARQGAAETECLVATDGQGHGEVAFAMSLRQNWPDPVEFSTREICYRPVPKHRDLVHFVARRLRRHVMEDLGKPTLKQRVAESVELKSLLQSYIIKLFYAVENQGIMMYGQPKTEPVTFRQVMTFAEAKDNLKRLRAAGVAKVHTQSVGWNPSGHDGLWPTRFPIDERLGGETAFRDLIEFGKSIGYTMNVHDNHLSAYRRSPDFDEERMVFDQWGQPMGLGEWGGGITYILGRYAGWEKWAENQMRQVKALGLNGTGYLDGMGNPLYRDYHPRHRGTRTDYARETNGLIEIAKRVYGAAGTECGFMYCAIPADCLTNMGSEWHMRGCLPEWPVTQLMEKRVPLWALTLHDLVIVEGAHALNWPGCMEAILFGLHPRDEWSAHPGVMPVLDNPRIRRLKAVYDLCLGRFGYLQLEELVKYEETAEGIKATTFGDGTTVIADFKKQKLVVNGKRVTTPLALQGRA